MKCDDCLCSISLLYHLCCVRQWCFLWRYISATQSMTKIYFYKRFKRCYNSRALSSHFSGINKQVSRKFTSSDGSVACPIPDLVLIRLKKVSRLEVRGIFLKMLKIGTQLYLWVPWSHMYKLKSYFSFYVISKFLSDDAMGGIYKFNNCCGQQVLK